MINLICAILCSTLISVLMRAGENKIKNNMAMFVVNYLFCEVCAVSFMGGISFKTEESGMSFAILLGAIAGILYLVNFVLLQVNIRENGVVLASTFMRLGVLIPTLMAILVFREQPKLIQILGIALAIVAIIVIQFEKDDAGTAKYKSLLLIMLFVAGITDSTANIFDKLGNSALKDNYLFVTFGAAAVCAVILWVKEKQKICLWDVIMGFGIGIPNYFSARFLLLALGDIPAMITYPVYSIMTIVTISLAGVLLFKESLSKKKILAMGIIFVAIVLLNL